MPQSNGRLAIALLVVVAGAALAWTFRQPESSVENKTEGGGIVYRESPPPAVSRSNQSIGTANLSAADPFSTLRAEGQGVATQQETYAAASNDGLINVVPRDYSAEASSGAIAHTARRIPTIDGPDVSLPSNPPQDPNMDVYRGSGARRHKIADGDSLASLAARYLGDANRAHEIFEMNRDKIPAEDVLPIGVTIVIPRQN